MRARTGCFDAGLQVRRFSLAAMLLFAIVPTAAGAREDQSDALREAQAALAAGDHGRAYPLYLEQAESAGNPLAMFTLGLFFDQGWGRPVDRKKACLWYEKAAAGKIPAAEHFTGDCLRQGIHREADPAAAAQWYQRAADHGHLMSLCTLAELLVAGEGLPRDPQRGIALCLKAAQNGLKPAQLRLARFYLDGAAGPPNHVAARQVLTVAAEADAPEAQYLLATLYRDGLGTAADPAKALDWFEHAAGRGYLPAYAPTAQLYLAQPRDPDSRLLPAAALAKAYLWASALRRRAAAADEVGAAEKLLEEIRKEIPETWLADLDRKVDRHLAGLAETPARVGHRR